MRVSPSLPVPEATHATELLALLAASGRLATFSFWRLNFSRALYSPVETTPKSFWPAMITDINSEDRLVQKTFADHLRDVLGWESIYAFNEETFGPSGTLGRASERDAVLVRDLREALKRLNPDLPETAREEALEELTRVDYARSLLQHNREF